MLEKIVAEVPRVKNPYRERLPQKYQHLSPYSFPKNATKADYENINYAYVWDRCKLAQCQLLAEQGYRPMPSVDDCFYFVSDKLMASMDLIICKEIAKKLHRWLLEGE